MLPNTKIKIVNKSVVFVTINCGNPNFLQFGNGEVRVYPNEKEIDARLTLGGHQPQVIETAEEFRAKLKLNPEEYEGGEFLVRLAAAKIVCPEQF